MEIDLFIFYRHKIFHKIFFEPNKKMFIGMSRTTLRRVRKLNVDEIGHFNEWSSRPLLHRIFFSGEVVHWF